VPYPTAQEFFQRSNTADPQTGFPELHRSDFITAVGRVSHRQLDRLEVGPYQMALLKRGLSKREEEEEEESDLCQAMEYSAAVGTMLVDDLASVNERVGNALDIQSNRIGEWWEDYQESDVRMTSLEEWKDVTMADLASLEVRLDQDELDKELMVQETEDLKARMEGLERQLAESRQEVDLLMGERADFRTRMDQMRDMIVDQEMRLILGTRARIPTGDKGPNTHWAHCEHIESTGNM